MLLRRPHIMRAGHSIATARIALNKSFTTPNTRCHRALPALSQFADELVSPSSCSSGMTAPDWPSDRTTRSHGSARGLLYPTHLRVLERGLLWQSSDQNSRRFFASGPLTVKVPTMGDSISEGTIAEWKKDIGDHVNADEAVVIIETDKVSVDVNAPESGIVIEQHAKPGDTVLVGADLFALNPTDALPQSPPTPIKDGEIPKTASPATEEALPTTPTGQSQPVDRPPTKKEAPPPSPPTPANPASPPPSAKSSSPKKAAPPSPKSYVSTAGPRVETRSQMSRIRQRVAERLKSAQESSASLTTFNECDMSALMAMRSALNEDVIKTHGFKFGFVSAFMAASAKALMRMPNVNSYIDPKNPTEIISSSYVDISVAVATPTGLVVPVIKDCERKSIIQLEAELADIAERARKGKVALEEMAGGTFTISNGGVFGSLFGTPIINPPQSSILGLHSIKDRATVVNGEVVVRPIMYLALTYDHQIIDGREAVTFLNAVKSSIEDPRRLLLDI